MFSWLDTVVQPSWEANHRRRGLCESRMQVAFQKVAKTATFKAPSMSVLAAPLGRLLIGSGPLQAQSHEKHGSGGQSVQGLSIDAPDIRYLNAVGFDPRVSKHPVTNIIYSALLQGTKEGRIAANIGVSMSQKVVGMLG